MHRLYRQYIKRIFDFTLSLVALIVLFPLIIILTVITAIMMRGDPFFLQERPGYKGKIFKLYKFKTMLDPQTLDGRKLTDKERLKCIENGIDILSDEDRLIPFGRFLRATSLDELPELINILMGDMSIIGPRPWSTIYLPYYTKEEMRRHDVRPGLTGLAQVNGRNSASWEKRFEYDLYYVDHCSLILDIQILFKTISIVFKKEDIGQGNEKPIAFSTVRKKQWETGEVIKDR